MRIAVVKPDWHIVGGYERLLGRVASALEGDGHVLTTLPVDVPALPRAPFGIDVPPAMWDDHVEYFRYMALVDAFQHIDVRGFDMVISTQPPSFVVDHRRHLALFSHHHKVYYDLSDAYVASGMARAEPHRHAERQVRRVDSPGLRSVTRFLCASDVVRQRIVDYNGITAGLDTYHAGPMVEPPPGDEIDRTPGTHVLCVTRHEFSKRSEVFVHGMRYLRGVSAVVTGGGGRLPFVREMDRRMAAQGFDLDALTDADLWLNPGQPLGVPPSHGGHEDSSDLRVAGHVDDAELQRLYRTAICTVAPAFSEDYGLTAVEAMAYGRPVVVCRDGGGLVGFVEDGVTGFVVEPTGRAIATAVRRLVDDPALALRMGIAARERALEYTWARALVQVRTSVERVMSGPG